jgi:hypothetical protein
LCTSLQERELRDWVLFRDVLGVSTMRGYEGLPLKLMACRMQTP